PAVGRATASHGYTPRRCAAALDGLLQGQKVLPCLGHGVVLGREVFRVVPDEALDGGPRKDLVELAVAQRLAELDPALRGAGLQLTHVDRVVERLDLALLRKLGEQLRARRGREVRRVSGRPA